MFEELVRVAGEVGFHQYEVANFGHLGGGAFEIPDEARRHNINYWRGGDYHGLGPSATGYVGACGRQMSATLRRIVSRWKMVNARLIKLRS